MLELLSRKHEEADIPRVQSCVDPSLPRLNLQIAIKMTHLVCTTKQEARMFASSRRLELFLTLGYIVNLLDLTGD